MLSRTSEYALRAMIYLTQHAGDWPVPGHQIAKNTGVPPKYLSTILRILVRAEVLTATRGKKGGFQMVHRPEEVSLYAVLAPFEPFDAGRCPFGNLRCGDDDPCLAHEQWKRVLEARMRFLTRTTVYDVAVAADRPTSGTRTGASVGAPAETEPRRNRPRKSRARRQRGSKRSRTAEDGKRPLRRGL